MADGTIQYVLRMKDEASGGMREVVLTADELRKQIEAATAAVREQERAQASAKRAEEEAAAARAAVAAAVEAEAAALSRLNPEIAESVVSYKLAKDAAEQEAKALGLTVAELVRLKAAHEASAQAAVEAAKREAKAAADVVAHQEATAKAADEAAKKLRQMAATGDDAKAAAIKMAELRAQVEKLVAVTGNKQMGAEALAAVAKSMSDVQAVAKPTTAAVTTIATSTAEAMDVVEKSAGMGRMQMLSIKYAAADAANSLIAGASPFMVLMQQGPQVVEAMTMMDGGWKAALVSLKSYLGVAAGVGAILGAMGIAVGEVVGVMHDYTEAKREATRADQMFAAAQLPLKDALKAAKEEQALLAQALESGDGKRFLDVADISKGVDAREAEATKALRDELDSLMTEYGKLDAAGEATFGGQQLRARIDGINEEIAAIHDQANELARLQTVNLSYRKVIDDSSKGTEKHAAASGKAKKADDEFQAQVDELNARLKERAEVYASIEDAQLRAASTEMAGIMAQIEAEQELARVQAERRAAALQSAASGVGMATSGPQGVMSGVAAAGPWGAIIAAIASVLTYRKDPETGQVTDGIANLGDTFNEFTIGFNQAIGHLPQTLGQNLGKWLETGTQSAIDMVPDFVAGLADSLPDILGGVINSIPKMTGALLEATIIELPKAIISLVKTLFSADLWVGLWEGFKEAMVEAWESIWGNAEATTSGSGAFNQGGMFDRMFVGKKEKAAGESSTFFNKGGIFDAIWGGVNENWWGAGFDRNARNAPRYATGGWVDRTGLALVHQGEYVTPASGSQSGTADAQGMGPQRGRVSGRGGQIVIDVEDFIRAFNGQTAGRGLGFGAA